jgi:hypothetical protein
MLGHTDVQQHRMMVRTQDDMISIVPRPSGEDLHPCVVVPLEDVISIIAKVQTQIQKQRAEENRCERTWTQTRVCLS